MNTPTLTVNVVNPNVEQYAAIQAIMNGEWAGTTKTTGKKKTNVIDDEETSDIDVSALKSKSAGNKAKTKKAPLKTVDEEEDEDFGTSAIDEDDEVLAVGDDDPADFDDEDEVTVDDDEDEVPMKKAASTKKTATKKKAVVVEEDDEDALDWDTVKAAINKYGAKNAKGMKTILASFNFAKTSELQASKNKWEPVYRKVMAKLKAK